MQTRRKACQNQAASIPPIPNIPLPVLDVPPLSEPFRGDEFVSFAYSHRWSTTLGLQKDEAIGTLGVDNSVVD